MEDYPPGLEEYFRQHNRRATLLAIGCLCGSLASWGLVYGVLLWAELLFLTTTRGIDAPTMISVRWHFLVIAGVLLIIGSLVRKYRTQDEKFHLGIALISLLSIPARFTYAVWDNLRARVHPSLSELAGAWTLLDFLREQKKIAVTNLPALLASGAGAGRVSYLLSIIGLIDTDNYGGIYYHHLRNEQAERHVRRWTKSLLLEN